MAQAQVQLSIVLLKGRLGSDLEDGNLSYGVLKTDPKFVYLYEPPRLPAGTGVLEYSTIHNVR